MSYDLIALFDEAPIMIEACLHSLFNNLADRDQVFRNRGDMQHILEVGLFAVVSEWDIPDMLYWMHCVITCFDIPRTFGLP